MQTNLVGRLNNTSLPLNSGLLPVYEAVVNSIHAIEEAGLPPLEGRIRLRIKRDPTEPALSLAPGKPGPEPTARIADFIITDNGIGFHDANMQSFETLDSDYKANLGGRGMGRLLWLKAFDHARIESVFESPNGTHVRRSFTFRSDGGIVEHEFHEMPAGTPRITEVRLEGFNEKYRQVSNKTAPTIARGLLEHCLWYFLRPGSAPLITVSDDDQELDLHQMYDHYMLSQTAKEDITVKGNPFSLTHVHLSAEMAKPHCIAYCASNRVVQEESLFGRIIGLYKQPLLEQGAAFAYSCYVTSPYLDQNVRSERTAFNIAEDASELFKEVEVSRHEIRDAVISRISAHLAPFLEENIAQGSRLVREYITQKAPRYRPLLRRLPESRLAVEPSSTEREIDLHLSKELIAVEQQFMQDGHDIMSVRENENPEDYEGRLRKYLDDLVEFKKSDLAQYVTHRRVILDLFESAIERGEDGKYCRENVIHELIAPRRCDTLDETWGRNNLWIVDERYAFYDYIASDKPLREIPIVANGNGKKPDIIGLRITDNPLLASERDEVPLASIVIVEIKRPMREGLATRGGDPVDQTLDYLSRVREGRVRTMTGRPIPQSMNIPGFCYVLCDITPRVREWCVRMDYTPTDDQLGFFFYHKNLKAFVEIMSFDRLLKAAKERNNAFFVKLGLPSK